jgi:PAS domain S-box-containing protein
MNMKDIFNSRVCIRRVSHSLVALLFTAVAMGAYGVVRPLAEDVTGRTPHYTIYYWIIGIIILLGVLMAAWCMSLLASVKRLKSKVCRLDRELTKLNRESSAGNTERRLVVRALEESERRLSTLLGNLPGMAYRCDNDHNRTMAFITEGCLEITGYKPMELIINRGASYADLLHPDDRETIWEQIQQALQEKRPFQLLYRIRDAAGCEKWLWEKGSGVYGQDGEAVALEGFIADISERISAEDELAKHREHLEVLVQERTQELQEAQRELITREKLATLGRLTATVGHELRNPMGTIRTALFALSDRLTGRDASIDRILARAERNITRCDGIIDELLDFTRTRKPLLELTLIDEWLEEMLEEYDFPETIPLIRELRSNVSIAIDRELLSRCMINILNNACDAMSSAEEYDPDMECMNLTISSRVHNDRLEIECRDEGSGILPEEMDRIFEPLYSTKGFGVGLGLSIVRQIMQLHHGDIDITSNLGEGAVVTLWLPLDNQQERGDA